MSNEALTLASQVLQEGLNWDYLLEVSIRHAVSPLFYHGLRQVSHVTEISQRVPARVLEELQKLYRGNQSRNRRLYRVIGEIVKAFGRVGVQGMGLKDLPLAWEVYPDIGLRPMGDIDILIRPADYRKVAKCLHDLGFVPLPSPDIPLTLKYACAHHFHRPTDNVWVDIQWNVHDLEWDVYHEGNFDFEIERMWRGASLTKIDDYHILTPKPEDTLFHLCLHLEGHQYCELILFCDIAELLRHYDNRLDWEYLVTITKKYKAESSIYYVLFLTQHLFNTPLPPHLLRELEPAYFKANLFGPLSSNLTPLHLSLDEIRLTCSPPDELMREFETAVRRQTIGAMEVYKEIDDLASAFINSGGALIILNGASSAKTFPDPSLRPFEEMLFFILDRDLSAMRQILRNRGFQPGDAQNSETYTKSWEVPSRDPLLADQPTLIAPRVDIAGGLDRLFSLLGAEHVSKKDSALKSVKAKLRGHRGEEICIPVQIKITALSPEEMFLYLSTRVSKQKQDRLFGLCSLLELLRGYPGPFNCQQITSLAKRYGVSASVHEAMQLVGEFWGSTRFPATIQNLPTCSVPQPRVLEWARYGPDSLVRYTDFKRAFYFLFSFLSLEGRRAKFKYLFRSLFGDQGRKPVLPDVMLELVTSTFALLRKKRLTTRDLAYWIEPESAFEAEHLGSS